MNEYIFFDASLRDRFLNFVSTHGLSGELRPDPMGHLLVILPDDLADDLEEAIENEYDAIMDTQRELIDASEGEDAYDAVGISVELAGGPRQLRLPPEVARMLYQHFSTQEIHDLVSAIARSVETAKDGPLCKR